MKKCKVCGEEKPKDAFYAAYTYNGKKICRPECKECNKKKSTLWGKNNPDRRRSTLIKHVYGIDSKEYERLLETQGKKCAICGSFRAGGKRVHFDIDHNHTTGAVRGLLCRACNYLIGNAKENVELLHSAIKYLEKHC